MHSVPFIKQDDALVFIKAMYPDTRQRNSLTAYSDKLNPKNFEREFQFTEMKSIMMNSSWHFMTVYTFMSSKKPCYILKSELSSNIFHFVFHSRSQKTFVT